MVGARKGPSGFNRKAEGRLEPRGLKAEGVYAFLCVAIWTGRWSVEGQQTSVKSEQNNSLSGWFLGEEQQEHGDAGTMAALKGRRKR